MPEEWKESIIISIYKNDEKTDLVFWHIIPTRYTSLRVYFYLTLLYMFRALLSPIVRSTKQL